ncbi:MAG: aldehyde dehydrogenase family protein [Deltaproteobacteria bacterium]|nr:aldehyde dehydrogenase family protein [Deltaproteobacteria bacterium]
MYIDGELVESTSGKTYPNINPATEEILGYVADAGTEDMQRAIAAARRAFDETDWSTNHDARLEILDRFAEAIRGAADAVLRPQIVAEVGQPITVTHGPGCDTPIEHMQWVLDNAKQYKWDRDIGDAKFGGTTSRRYVWREAIGVVGAITPWNFPVQVNLAKVIPALAAGNTVILKPAPDTPWNGTALGKIAHEVGLPPGVFNVVTAENPAEVGEVLTKDPRVDMVSFTGSTAVGKRIMANASETVKKVFLELGGKSALIVLDDADFSSALLMAIGVCFHAGQGCAINTRLLLPRSRYQEGVDFLTPIFKTIGFGDPTDPSFIMGPVINKTQYEKILGLIQTGIDEGATLVAGGGAAENFEKGYFIQPTLFTNVTNEMTIARQEIFGPVLAVIPFEDDDDAVRIANDSRYGLSGTIMSESLERSLAMARRIRTGTLNVNGGLFYAADAPFGGYKESGIGREMGIEGFEEYLETKTVAVPSPGV